ncbi:serine protease [Synechococcus sp. WH 8020]|uniref:serine protease n=1 Tax=Synechococcus sp. (strain WH8020) TaxID=32052 RepID=UPI000A6DAB75|nr:serine protease [Synechococcus sp. WH 8020]
MAMSLLFLFPFSSMALDLRTRPTPDKLESNTTDLANTQKTPSVQILSGGASGSAVVIGQKGNTYYALTANHVVKDYGVSELLIKLQDGSTINVANKQTPFNDIDLAIIKFNSKKVIPVAILPFLDDSLWQIVDSWPTIQVIGFSTPTPDAPSMVKVINGTPNMVLNKSLDGYNFLYSANTQVGLSGGGVYGSVYTVVPKFIDSESKNSGFYYTTHDAINKASESNQNTSESNQNIAATLGDYAKERMNDIQEALANSTNPMDLAKRFSQSSSFSSSNKPQPVIATQKHAKIEESSWLPSQKVIFKRCMANKNWNPKFDENNSYLKTSWNAMNRMGRSDACDFIAKMDSVSNCEINYLTYPDKDPQSYLLLAIHGRSERRDFESTDRTGSGLGVFLASPQIANYLKNNSKNLGLRKAFSYAKQVCISQNSSI